MRRSLRCALACGALAIGALTISALPLLAQVDPNPALNNPDKLSWQIFIQVNSRADGTNSVFETFASDSDTFKVTPQYPAGPSAPALHAPILETIATETALKNGVLLPAVPPDPATAA